jgi:hypothetical protein
MDTHRKVDVSFMVEGYSSSEKNAEAESSFRALMCSLGLNRDINYDTWVMDARDGPEGTLQARLATVRYLCVDSTRWHGMANHDSNPCTGVACTAEELDEAAVEAGWCSDATILGKWKCYRMYPEDAQNDKPIEDRLSFHRA